MLIWPDGQCYEDYRLQMMCFNIYLAFIQYLQFAYQRGVLYRLRSLGERSTDMDITIDGFHSWMFKGRRVFVYKSKHTGHSTLESRANFQGIPIQQKIFGVSSDAL